VTVINTLAHAETLLRRRVQTMGSEHCRSESLVQTRASVQDAATARDAAHGQNYFKDYKRLGPFAKLATTYKAKPAAKR